MCLTDGDQHSWCLLPCCKLTCVQKCVTTVSADPAPTCDCSTLTTNCHKCQTCLFLGNLTWKCVTAEGEKSAVIITSTAGPRVTRSLCRDTRLGSAYSSLLLGISLKYLGGRTSSSSSSRLCVELGLSLPGTPPPPFPDAAL